MAFAQTQQEGDKWLLDNDLHSFVGTLQVGLGVTADINTPPLKTTVLAGITEISGGGYARQTVTFGVPTNTGSDGLITAAAGVTFTFTGTPTGVPTYWFVTDGTTLLFVKSLQAARTFGNGDTDAITPALQAT